MKKDLPVVDKALIHLVDDDDAVRSTIARLLISGGYRVREYASGRKLLESAAALADDDCILLDINMPDTDGFAVQRALADKGIKLPVIMMTGSGDLTILAYRAGVAEFMQKPFGRGELLSVLDQISTQQRANV